MSSEGNNRVEHFDRKSVERGLFATYMPCAADKRRTRTLLRKAARRIEHAYRIGQKDAASGKVMVMVREVPPADSPMKKDIFRRAYEAYRSGYLEGSEPQ